MSFIKVCKESDCPVNTMKQVEAGGRIFVLANIGGNFYCMDGYCTHQFAELASGELKDKKIICQLHGAAFDAKTGDVLEGPAYEKLNRYPTKLEKGEIWVDINGG